MPSTKYSPKKHLYTRICQRCGKVMHKVPAKTKYCPECRDQAYLERAVINSRELRIRKAAEKRAAMQKDADLLFMSRVADWAGITYGTLMVKSPADRAAIIAQYTEAKKEKKDD